MAKHAEDLTISPYDMIEYVVADHSDPRGPLVLTRKKRRIERGLPRPAHAGGWTKTNRAAIERELEAPLFVVPDPEPLPRVAAFDLVIDPTKFLADLEPSKLHRPVAHRETRLGWWNR